MATGVYLLRNIAGYNAMAVDLGRCLAVVDAPASYSIGPLPTATPGIDRGAMILEMLDRVVPGKPVCYVVPTHHHSDHFGGIGALVEAGASVVTSPANVGLVSRVLGRTSSKPRVLVVRGDRLVLNEGGRSLEIHLIPNDTHVDETLVGYLPDERIVLTADIEDYVLSARNFVRVAAERGIRFDRLFGAHNSTHSEPRHLLNDDPSN